MAYGYRICRWNPKRASERLQGAKASRQAVLRDYRITPSTLLLAASDMALKIELW